MSEERKIGVVSCSGEDCLGGTISRLATRKMLDEVNDGAVAHHHTLGHAGGAGGEDSVQGVRISGLPADGRKETAVQSVIRQRL